jgi:hypothetical protein
MPNPIYRQGTEAIVNFLGFGGKENIVYDEFLSDSPLPRMDKALEQRGYMKFIYGDATPGTLIPRTRLVPFFEDPVIKESREANYAEYEILLRNEPFRTYVNTGAKNLTIEINFSIPHIVSFFDNYNSMLSFNERLELAAMVEQVRKIIVADYKSGANNKFRLQGPEKDDGSRLNTLVLADSAPGDGPRMPAHKEIPLGEDAQENLFALRGFAAHWLTESPRLKIIRTFETLAHYFVNIIRSSVLSSSGKKNGVFAPPTFELKFGALYDKVPCIVKDYDLEFRGDLGWYNTTLYPRVVRLKITAEEFRQSLGESSNESSPKGWDDIFTYER